MIKILWSQLSAINYLHLGNFLKGRLVIQKNNNTNIQTSPKPQVQLIKPTTLKTSPHHMIHSWANPGYSWDHNYCNSVKITNFFFTFLWHCMYYGIILGLNQCKHTLIFYDYLQFPPVLCVATMLRGMVEGNVRTQSNFEQCFFFPTPSYNLACLGKDGVTCLILHRKGTQYNERLLHRIH